jgi:hypothetical protein
LALRGRARKARDSRKDRDEMGGEMGDDITVDMRKARGGGPVHRVRRKEGAVRLHTWEYMKSTSSLNDRNHTHVER